MYLSWLAPEPSHHNGIIQYYMLSLSEAATDKPIQTFTVSSNNATIVDLHPYYEYEVEITAFTIGEGPYTETSFTTEEDGKYFNLFDGKRNY